MAAKKPNPQVVAARQTARQGARAQGLGPQKVQQAGRQAARATRYAANQPVPQPPAPPAGGGGGQGGYYQYSPTAESQINQPYQDLNAAGAYQSLGDVLGRQQQQGQMADIYGQGAAGNLGGAQQGMGQLSGLGGQYLGTSGQSLGQYQGLMQPNYGIQRGLANEIQGIQGGNLDVDPAMVQQFDQQQRQLESQLQRQLGPDWASSSAGIEAMGRFQQGKQTALGSANYNRLLGLIGAQQTGMGNIGGAGLQFGGFGQGVQGQQFGQGAQLGAMYGTGAGQLFDQSQALRGNQLTGAGNMLNQLAQIQQLYGNIPTTMGQFGNAMTGQAGAAVNAQGPYQQDRLTQLGTQYAPTSGQMWGQQLANSGNRWAAIGASMMGSGGSPSGGQSNSYASRGYGNPATFNMYGPQFQE